MKRYWMILCLLLVASAKSFGIIGAIIGGAIMGAEHAKEKEAQMYAELLEYWKYQLAEGEKLESKDPYISKITQLKSVQSLPSEIILSYGMADFGGVLKIEFPILTKEQEEAKGLTNKDLDKTVDSLKKDINKIISKASPKWKENKDKKTGKVVLECTFRDKGTYSKLLASERKSFETYVTKKMSELETNLAAAKQKITQRDETLAKREAEWEQFQKSPYYFDFNKKLAGSKYICDNSVYNFLSETEVKYEEYEEVQEDDPKTQKSKGKKYEVTSFTFYDITERDAEGITIVPKNGGDETRLRFINDNVFETGHNNSKYIKEGYKRPAFDVKGKSFSEHPQAVSFIKSIGPENIPFQLSLGNDGYGSRSDTITEYIFQKDGKLKILHYEYKSSATPYVDMEYSINKRKSYKIKDYEDLKSILKELKEAEEKVALFESSGSSGSYIVQEDKKSSEGGYTWEMDKEGNVICKNKYSSSDNLEFSPSYYDENAIDDTRFGYAQSSLFLVK